MIPPKLAKSLLIGTLMISAYSYADTKVAESQKWALWETTVDNADVCYLQVVDKVLFRSEDFYLEISKLKNKADSPVEINMRIEKNKKGSTGLVATVNASSSTISFSDINDQKAKYWGVPKNLSVLVEQLKTAQEDIAVKAKGGKKDIDFTIAARGFKDMLAEMEKRCNNGASLVNKAFEDEFLASVAANVEPTALTSAKTNQLRSVYLAAYAVFSKLTDAKTSLQKVLDKYKPLTDELQANRARLNQILNQELPSRQKTLADSQAAQVSARAEIARIDALLPRLSAQVDASQKAYDQARAILAPLVPEFNRLTSAIDSAQSSLAEAQSRLSQIDSRLQQIAQQISSVSNEADQISAWLPQKQRSLEQALNVQRNAEFQRSQFNASFERDRRLRNNGEYSHMQIERSSVQNSLSSTQTELNQVQVERNRVAQAVEQCHASNVQIDAVVQSGQIVAQPEDQDPGLVTDPAVDPVLQPEPAADCSQLEQALAQADGMVAEKQNAVNSLANRLNSLNSSLSNIERQVDSDVRRDYDTLVSQENNARRETNRIQDDVNRDQNRLSQIRNSELPNLTNERSQLTNERPGVVSDINQSTSALNSLTQQLNQFRVVNDWDRKANDVSTKGRQLAVDQDALASAQSQKSSQQARLQNAIATEAQMKDLIAKLNSEVVTLNARAAELNKGLAGLPAERAPIDQLIAQQQNDLTANKNNFLDLLK